MTLTGEFPFDVGQVSRARVTNRDSRRRHAWVTIHVQEVRWHRDLETQEHTLLSHYIIFWSASYGLTRIFCPFSLSLCGKEQLVHSAYDMRVSKWSLFSIPLQTAVRQTLDQVLTAGSHCFLLYWHQPQLWLWQRLTMFTANIKIHLNHCSPLKLVVSVAILHYSLKR